MYSAKLKACKPKNRLGWSRLSKFHSYLNYFSPKDKYQHRLSYVVFSLDCLTNSGIHVHMTCKKPRQEKAGSNFALLTSGRE